MFLPDWEKAIMQNTMEPDKLLEAVLFWKAEPFSVSKLSELLGRSEGEINESLGRLEDKLRERGVRLVRKNDEVMLGTAPEASALIEKLTKEELARDLGKAGLETLTIVIYRGPISRAEIDYIRGVNSSFILRNLQIRDLVEKITDPADSRRFLYQPTFSLLQHLGVSKIEELPEYGEISAELNNLITQA